MGAWSASRELDTRARGLRLAWSPLTSVGSLWTLTMRPDRSKHLQRPHGRMELEDFSNAVADATETWSGRWIGDSRLVWASYVRLRPGLEAVGTGTKLLGPKINPFIWRPDSA